MTESRPLRVFLCHASQDKPKVRELYQRLKSEKWIKPWLDEVDLLGGQDFDLEIYRAIRDTDAIIICLSAVSVAKEGYVNREIRRALDIAQEKAEGAIYVIPLRLDDCHPSFESLRKLHWVDYFIPDAHERLLRSLRARAEALRLAVPDNDGQTVSPKTQEQASPDFSGIDTDLYRFSRIPATEEAPYPFWIGKYPVTNAQYERFLKAPDYGSESYWHGFLKFNEDCMQIGRWGSEGWDWLKEKMGGSTPPLLPEYWNEEGLGISNPDNPVVGVSWYESSAYCRWMARHWNEVAEGHVNTHLRPHLIRLPLDTEWTAAAGGDGPSGRYPWDAPRKATTDQKEIIRRANVRESGIGHTTPVNAYLRGASPHGVMDLAGNVWEWLANYTDMQQGRLGLRGGSWSHYKDFACVSTRIGNHPSLKRNRFGFRLVCLPHETFS